MKRERFAFVDIETRSKTDLAVHGVDRYFDDPSASIIVCVVKFSDEKTHRVIENFGGKRLLKLPACLTNFKGTFVAHNWSFEFAAFARFAPGTRLADPANWLCTQALAFRFNLPHSLGACADTLKLPVRKSPDGKRLINSYSIPDKKTGELAPIPAHDRQPWIDYCADDVYVSELIFEKLFPWWTLYERRVFDIDRIINAQGVPVDVAGARRIKAAFAKFIEKAERDAEKLAGFTDGGALAIRSPQAFKAFCAARGEALSDAQADTVTDLYTRLQRVKKPTKAQRELLQACEIREVLAARAVDKTNALLDGVAADGQYRYGQKYHAAHTGRWQSWGANFYNFPREACKPDEWLNVLADAEKHPTLDKFVSLQRGLIAAGKGQALVISDYAGIENRILLWLAKDHAQLARIAAGESPYLIFAEKLYPGERVTKADTAKYTAAKAAVLGLGYYQGAGKFALMNDYDEAEAQKIVYIWRASHPGVVALWYDFDRAFRSAIADGDNVAHGIRFYKRKSTVCVELPDGHVMYYRGAHLRPSKKKGFEGKTEIAAFFGKSDTAIALHGGVLTENIVQALATRLLRGSLLSVMEKTDAFPFLHVYDEIVCLSPKARAKADAKKIAACMVNAPAWAKGLPLAVEQKICGRWAK
jgi:DNA polymerase